ncbi:basic-leucine zipper transcription factor nucleus DNA binding regulation of transcription, DNA-dependent [Cryphonectria parasitica EP155]|uniref:Basic-leucine zipper transcription factor nucleus DNA binding regulation of transcription, DNA-dependent n=1 Tax=Cryphonectria parasitica (strain ATCC 38755 / EP155) TaxID=660469 RepID=A0A9P4Y848_CRYP1|nr:basic-leucine zipper transcription factor nucleus DNA binding regulation of transcription, DNA-dependent [Cryphonectria parasitica EP155]KAF3768508.1 basic-leucine zipper transcription factor nucleus DNA binding regulation of transcription, DNA-dependent [Cryphonectria parasitica EP155]
MSYSQAPYYPAAYPPYNQYPMGISPLTPSHPNSAGSQEFNNMSSSQQQQQQPPPLPLPLPQDFHGADLSSPVFNPAPYVDGPAMTNVNIEPKKEAERSSNSARGSHSADEEDEEAINPNQAKRKVQNRNAQRAFRERKERHVKDLETKVADLEQAKYEKTTENEKLKKDLQKANTENEILRATAAAAPPVANPVYSGYGYPDFGPTTTGPMHYNPTDFYTRLLANHPGKRPSHRIRTTSDGVRLYGAGATWEYIIGHELYKQGLVDVGDISNRLRYKAVCDGQGPAFDEKTINDAIEQSVGSGSDRLI